MTDLDVLRQYFGYESFRPGQREIVSQLLEGRDCLAVMPTGAGKSLCYQIPAMLLPGLTLVISPLISLMQDQVKALIESGISAAFVNSTLTEHQQLTALHNASRGIYRILYVAPERLGSESFFRFAAGTEISMVTVDEAHCISQWGQDFRPSYLAIADFIAALPRRPVVGAFTATATDRVREDIIRALELRDPFVRINGFDRPNLRFEVRAPRDKDSWLLSYVKSRPTESGIVYCATRKNTDAVCDLLTRAGIRAVSYHAGRGAKERTEAQNDFIFDRAPVIVATNAFGMGIDKSNVRYVIHYNMPQSMENYYQEAGRAGRDGIGADCILLYSAQDVIIDRYLIEHKEYADLTEEEIQTAQRRDLQRLRVMEDYCTGVDCLRGRILTYFGEDAPGECGNCSCCGGERTPTDLTEQARAVMNCVYETGGRYGSGFVIGVLRGSKQESLQRRGAYAFRTYGRLKDTSSELLRVVIDHLVRAEYLTRSEDLYGVLRLGPQAWALRDPALRVVVGLPERLAQSGEAKRIRRKSAAAEVKAAALTAPERALFDALRSLRAKLAGEAGVPPYVVFPDSTLRELCVRRPGSVEELSGVPGIGEIKKRRYGPRFLEAIRDFLEAHPGEFPAKGAAEKDEAASPMA